MYQKIKNKIKMTLVLVFILVVIIFAIPNPSITGHGVLELNTQLVDLTISKNKDYYFTTNSKESFYVTSLKLTGEVTGDGQVSVYLQPNNGQRLKMFSNIKKKDRGLTSITMVATGTQGKPKPIKVEQSTATNDKQLVIKPMTGYVRGNGVFEDLMQGQKLEQGYFSEKCEDACLMNMEFSKTITHKIIVSVEPGTTLRINKITYLTKE